MFRILLFRQEAIIGELDFLSHQLAAVDGRLMVLCDPLAVDAPPIELNGLSAAEHTGPTLDTLSRRRNARHMT
jgi:hypothetical protein